MAGNLDLLKQAMQGVINPQEEQNTQKEPKKKKLEKKNEANSKRRSSRRNSVERASTSRGSKPIIISNELLTPAKTESNTKDKEEVTPAIPHGRDLIIRLEKMDTNMVVQPTPAQYLEFINEQNNALSYEGPGIPIDSSTKEPTLTNEGIFYNLEIDQQLTFNNYEQSQNQSQAELSEEGNQLSQNNNDDYLNLDTSPIGLEFDLGFRNENQAFADNGTTEINLTLSPRGTRTLKILKDLYKNVIETKTQAVFSQVNELKRKADEIINAASKVKKMF